MSSSFQNDYAGFYDLLYGDKDYTEEIDFIERIFSEYATEKPVSVLDLACGTGNHLIQLMKRGYQAEGLDLSKGMLEIAEKKLGDLAKQTQLYEGALQNFSIGKTLDAVMIMFSALNYVTTYDDLKTTLRNVHAHLNPGGILYFDGWNGLAVLGMADPYRKKVVEDNALKLERESNTQIDTIAQISRVHYTCRIFENGRSINEFEETHVLKFFFIDELKNYLTDAGFEVLSVGTFLNLDDAISANDFDINFVARKI